jgi:hypothetical protein
MSYFHNASAFLAVGKRFSLDIRVRRNDGSEYHLAIDDCHSVEELVQEFDKHFDLLCVTLKENLRNPKGKAWDFVLWGLFDLHEYHSVERFAAVSELVHMLNEDE